ncbi:MAG TPA: hypothetical protein VI485_01795 [Vicinamibacterales bacterium]|nr:hypothetical protein [Vicinamibacterales bacterium]
MAPTHARQDGATNIPAQANPPAATLPTLDNVRVTSIVRPTRQTGATAVAAGIGDTVVLRVDHLADLIDRSKCIGSDGKPFAGCREQVIALYLDGREIKGLVPESGAPLKDQQTLQFHLQRSAGSDEAWADLLGAPPLKESLFFRRPTGVSVGLANAYALPSDVGEAAFELIRIRKGWFIASSLMFGGVLLLLVALILNSEIVRDSGPVPIGHVAGWVLRKRKHKPYSLARVQMAFWFVLTVASFLFIWLVTNASDTITASTLALIGIAAGTFLGSVAIDSGRAQSQTMRSTELTREETALTVDIASLGAMLAAVPPPANAAALQEKLNAAQARRGTVTAELAPLRAAAAPAVSNGFINDILTDSTNGISFHRFQMFVWTLVLGIVFLNSVWTRLSMPEFSATLLGLLGISGGTYLGFKIPES